MKILKIPYSKGSLGKNKECSLAPDSIIKELDEVWCSENHKQASISVEEIDAEFDDFKDLCSKVYQKLNLISQKTICLGGDHSITYPCFKSFRKFFSGHKIALVIFDAHPDVFQEFDSVDHQNYLKCLIDEGTIKGENVFIIGLRNWSEKEIDYFKSNRIRWYSMKKIMLESLPYVCDTITEFLRVYDSLYLSIDIDAVDPAFAPGTGYIEPGGFSSRELIYLIQRINLLNVKMADIVEVNPIKDVNGMTSKLAAKIIKELI